MLILPNNTKAIEKLTGVNRTVIREHAYDLKLNLKYDHENHTWRINENEATLFAFIHTIANLPQNN
jgi:hypothetical protein